MIPLLWSIIAVLVLLLVFAGNYFFQRGYEAGCREQRRVTNRAMDEVQQQGLAAQRNIDYLYERARWQITALARPEGTRHE
jgi:hypothetical protein